MFFPSQLKGIDGNLGISVGRKKVVDPFLTVLLIRLGFSANADSDFYLNENPAPDPGSQTYPGPDPGQTLKSQS